MLRFPVTVIGWLLLPPPPPVVAVICGGVVTCGIWGKFILIDLSVELFGLLRGITVTNSGFPNSLTLTPPIFLGLELIHDFPCCAKPVDSGEMNAPPCLKYAAPGPEIPTCTVILLLFREFTALCNALTLFVALSACDFTFDIALLNADPKLDTFDCIDDIALVTVDPIVFTAFDAVVVAVPTVLSDADAFVENPAIAVVILEEYVDTLVDIDDSAVCTVFVDAASVVKLALALVAKVVIAVVIPDEYVDTDVDMVDSAVCTTFVVAPNAVRLAPAAVANVEIAVVMLLMYVVTDVDIVESIVWVVFTTEPNMVKPCPAAVVNVVTAVPIPVIYVLIEVEKLLNVVCTAFTALSNK